MFPWDLPSLAKGTAGGLYLLSIYSYLKQVFAQQLSRLHFQVELDPNVYNAYCYFKKAGSVQALGEESIPNSPPKSLPNP